MNMLIDTVAEYDNEKKQYFLGIWEKLVLSLATEFDYRKILAFLCNAWVIWVDENNKEILIGISSQFGLSQVKKFFDKKLREAVKNTYNVQYGVNYIIYPPFSDSKNELLSDLRKLLNIKEQEKKITNKEESSLKEELSKYFWNLFDPKFRFDNFVAGSNNEYAFAVAKAVAENPGKEANPLFLYGNVWLWKTHLMQAIWNEIMEKFPDKVVIYLPSNTLTEQIVQAILSNNKISALKNKFAQVDVLLIDDIQFLAERDKTQEVFLDIFNEFYTHKKQVILTSDRAPRELTKIASRLQTRFATWLIVDVKAPDYETRIAILRLKAQSMWFDISYELLSLIAQYIKSNVRELEWLLNSLKTRQQFLKREVTKEDVLEALITAWYHVDEKPTNGTVERVINDNPISNKNFDAIVNAVAEYYQVAVADITWDTRRSEVIQARQMLMYLAKKYFRWTHEKIWEYFWWRDHASATYSIAQMEKKLQTDPKYQHDYNVFVDWIESNND